MYVMQSVMMDKKIIWLNWTWHTSRDTGVHNKVLDGDLLAWKRHELDRYFNHVVNNVTVAAERHFFPTVVALKYKA